jgi:hypothetical protein
MYYMNISIKVTFLAHFDNLMGHINKFRISGSYSKIIC